MKKQFFLILLGICIFLFAFFSCKNEKNTIVNPPATGNRLPDISTYQGWVRSGTKYPHRLAGTNNWADYMKWVELKFLETGLQNITKDYFTVYAWESTGYSLKVDSNLTNIDIPCFYEYWSGFTATTGITRPLIYIGNSLEPSSENVNNKIVVADMPFSTSSGSPNPFVRPNHIGLSETNALSFIDLYWRCKTRGASAIVFNLSNSNTDNPKYMWPCMDSLPWTMPSLFVGKTAGARLISLAQSGKTSTLTLTGKAPTVNAFNLWAKLPGQSDSTIIITSHCDAPFNGAVEDASGVASLLAQAKAWAAIPQSQRKYTMIFVATAAHFYHNDIGSRRFADSHSAEIEKCKFLLAVEHLGSKEVSYTNNQMITGSTLTPGLIYHSSGLKTELQNMVNTYSAWTSVMLNETALPLSVASGYAGTYPNITYASFLTAPYYLVFSEDTEDKIDFTALENANKSILKFTENLIK